MGEYTPNIKLYKPSIGETEWGDLVNNNFDVLDEQIDSIKKELITMAIKILMNQAVAHAISKDFYSIIADVVTLDYPKGFKNTFESVSSPIEYEITIDNSNNPNDLTDYQILLEINNDEQFFEDCLYDQKLLEFYDEDKATLLNHYVEEWDTENYNAKIWIKVPNIPANSTKKIYLKINKDRTEDLSNPKAVFDFWDDFEGDSIDTNKWNVIDATGFSVSNSLLKGTNTTGVIHSIQAFTPETYGYTLEILLKPVKNATNGFTAGGFYKSTTDGLTYLKHPNNDHIRNDDTWINLGSEKMALNVFNKLIVTAKPDGTVDVKVIRTDTEETTYQATHTNTVSDEVIRLGRRADNDYTGQSYEAYWDWVRVRKYTDPEPTITYTRNVIPVDYVTVTFDFPEGVDKLLVTTDSDAQNVYYSTDDGNTWNPIERDTETELPETAYSIKLKFEQATYMRGYAFLTW